MAHFAKLNSNNVVVWVVVGRQEDDGREEELSIESGDVYKQTSYNTRGGIHYDPSTGQPSADQSKALRKNFAGIDWTYDPVRDAFIPPGPPFPSWTLDEQTCLWKAPIPRPIDEFVYEWNEETLSWVKRPEQPPLI